MVVATAGILFSFAALRHALFRSSSFDLGFFDQALFLISRGETPTVSLLGFHVLGDHAAFILYPLALLYVIHPSVSWLFAVQAIALAGGALPLWMLCLRARLAQSENLAICAAYLLQPILFNANLFDFHPEVLAVPALLCAALAAQRRRPLAFGISLVVTLGCKEVLALNVLALGLWLLLAEKNRSYGLVAILAGASWFTAAVWWLIPALSGSRAGGLARYGYLGRSLGEVVRNTALDPLLVLRQLVSWQSAQYLLLIFLPVVWGLSAAGLKAFSGGVPTLLLNLLADYPKQRTLGYQYSLPILPFLFCAIVRSRETGKGWRWRPRWIVLWSIAGFLALASYQYLWKRYPDRSAYLRAARRAVALVDPTGPVLTTADFHPHLSHRREIFMTNESAPPANLMRFDAVLLSTHRPGWQGSVSFTASLVQQLSKSPAFELRFQRDGVFLFVRRPGARYATRDVARSTEVRAAPSNGI
jgi:uncharacterized membrane protein